MENGKWKMENGKFKSLNNIGSGVKVKYSQVLINLWIISI